MTRCESLEVELARMKGREAVLLESLKVQLSLSCTIAHALSISLSRLLSISLSRFLSISLSRFLSISLSRGRSLFHSLASMAPAAPPGKRRCLVSDGVWCLKVLSV